MNKLNLKLKNWKMKFVRFNLAIVVLSALLMNGLVVSAQSSTPLTPTPTPPVTVTHPDGTRSVVINNKDGTRSVLIPEADYIRIEQALQELIAQRALNVQYAAQLKQAETLLAVNEKIGNLTAEQVAALKSEIKNLREAIEKGNQIEKNLQAELTRYKQKYYIEKLKFYGVLGIAGAAILFLLLRK